MWSRVKWLLLGLAGVLGILALIGYIASGHKPGPATPAPTPPVVQTRKVAKRKTDDDAGDDGDIEAEEYDGAPSWFEAAKADIGIREWKGKKHNPRVVAYFRDAGFPGIKNDETAWCAAFTNAHFERQGIPGSKSLAARSFERWGVALDEPRLGCVCVFWRGSRTGWQGHVGFYAGETETHIKCLGGNQSDGVSIALMPKSRLLGYRWPCGLHKSRTVAANTLGLVGTGGTVAVVAAQAGGLQTQLQALGAYWKPALVAALVLSVAVQIATIYFRWQDHKAKGR